MIDERRLTYLTTFVAVLAATWNIRDEMYIFQSMGVAIRHLIFWSLAPGLNLLICRASPKKQQQREYLGLSVFYAVVYLFYALNGSTADREGAGPLHLLLVPVFMIFILTLFHLYRLSRFVAIKWFGKQDR